MPDYCYSDRLFHQIETCFCNPWLSGFACYSRTFRLSFPAPRHGSGTKCHSGAVTYFPKDIASVSDNPEPKPVVFCCPVTQSLKERFRFSGDLLNIPHARSVLFRLRLAWCADPRVWPKQIAFHLSNLFCLHIFWAVFYRSPDRIKFTSGILKNNGNIIVIINPILTLLTLNC